MKNNKKLTPLNVLILAVILVVSGAIIASVGYLLAGGRIGVIGDSKNGFYYAYDQKEEAQPLERKSIDSFKNIEVESSFFNVHLVESDEFAIEGTDEKRIKFDVKNETLMIKTISDNENNNRYMTMFYFSKGQFVQDEIYVYYPKNSKFDTVDLDISHADLRMDNMEIKQFDAMLKFVDTLIKNSNTGDTKIITEQSDTRIANAQLRSLDANLKFGSITVSDMNIVGNALIKNEQGDMTLTNIQSKDFSLENKFGEGNFKNLEIDGNAKFDTEQGSVDIISLNAKDVKITSKFSDFDIYDASITKLDSNREQGGLNFSGTIAGDINLAEKFGTTKLNLVGEKTDYLIVATKSQFSEINLPKGYSTSNINDAKYKVIVEAEHSDVSIDIK